MDVKYSDLDLKDSNDTKLLEHSDDEKEADIGYHSLGRNIKVIWKEPLNLLFSIFVYCNSKEVKN